MMNRAIRLCWRILPLTMCLAGCATPVSQEERASTHKIAVVSAIGEKLRVLNIAPFFINHADFEVDISSWNIDRRVDNLVTAFLTGKFAVMAVDAKQDYLSWDAKKLFDDLKTSGRLGDADTVLVVTRADVINSTIGGLGVLHEVGEDYSRVFAVYEIDLYRTSDGARIAWSIKPSNSMPSKSIHRNIGSNAMQGQLSADEMAEVRAALENVLDESLPSNVQALGLTP